MRDSDTISRSLKRLQDSLKRGPDKRRLKRWRKTNDSLHKALKRVAPDISQKMITEVVYHLADYWEICEEHRLRVKQIVRLKSSRSRQTLADLIDDLLYVDLHAHLPYHLRGMKRVLPLFIETLEKSSRKRK